MFSLFGIQAGATSLPENVEIISFDETAGVFNFYDSVDGKIGFFGSSKDLLRGPDGEVRRCAKCHVGGGLVMKEQASPWLHWENKDGVDTPGAQELFATHDDLGERVRGPAIDVLVDEGNKAWNATRLAHLSGGDMVSTKALLEPLFCTLEFTIATGAPSARWPAASARPFHS